MTASSIASIASGRIFARDFRIVRPLQVGGMGAVYVAEQLSTGRERALKLMQPRFEKDDRFRARFEQEARVGAKIDSAHVVEVVSAGVDEETGAPWLCMELLRGQDLAALLAARGSLPAGEVHAIFEQVCHAVGAAHAVGVVHRDLKPENVFLALSRQAGVPFVVKVLDFGIAKVLAEGRTTDTSPLGTPLWMAPEQTVAGGAIGPPTDVWALGLIAFKLLTGFTYWLSAQGEESSVMAVLREIAFAPIDLASRRVAELGRPGALPAGFDAWFARCMEREAPARFMDAREAFAALGPALGVAQGASLPSIAVAAPVDETAARSAPRAGGASAIDTRPEGTPREPNGFEATEAAPSPRGTDGPAYARTPSAVVLAEDDAPASEPAERTPAAPRRSSGAGLWIALASALVVSAIGGVVVGVRAIFREAELRATVVVEDAERTRRVRDDAKAAAEAKTKSLERRAVVDRQLGAPIAVPAGSFAMGADDLGNDELPVHQVTVAAFELDAAEVTVAHYARCVAAGRCSEPGLGPQCNGDRPDRAEHPVNCIDWKQARAFCAWASKRLPTEEEWELAARGPRSARYPWGDSAPAGELCWKRLAHASGHADGTCPVGSAVGGASPFGAGDLAGNVREWTSTPYCSYLKRDCKSPARAVRGGAWVDDDPSAVLAAVRRKLPQDAREDSVGVRCARDTL